MQLNEPFISELKNEAQATRRILERVPDEHFGWKPHPKSMTLGELASHIAEVPNWTVIILTSHEFDFATSHYTAETVANQKELLNAFQRNLDVAIEELERAENDVFPVPWTMRAGDHVILNLPRIIVLRSVVMNHLVHHRGQLSVYLRLLDIPVPRIYGPTADEQ